MEHPKKKLSAIEKVRAKYGEAKKAVGAGAVGFGAGYAVAKGKEIADAAKKYAGKMAIREKVINEIGKGKELYKKSMETPKIKEPIPMRKLPDQKPRFKEPIPMRKPPEDFKSKFENVAKTGKKLSFKDAAKAASKVGAKNAVKGVLKSAAKKLPYIGAGIAIGEVGKDVYDYYKGKQAKNKKKDESKNKKPVKKIPSKSSEESSEFPPFYRTK